MLFIAKLAILSEVALARIMGAGQILAPKNVGDHAGRAHFCRIF